MTAPQTARRRGNANGQGHTTDQDQQGNGAGERARGMISRSGEKDKQSGKGQTGSRSSLVKNKHIIEEFVNVGVPRQVAFDEWMQYQDWSKIFMHESAEQKEDHEEDGQRGGRRPRAGKDEDDEQGDQDDNEEDDNEVSVRAKIGPSERQWKAEVMALEPGRRVEWQAKDGVQAKGVVTFHHLDDRLTYLQVVIHYVPSGFMETTGNFLRMPRRRVRKDLRLFKNFLDLRGKATGEGPKRVQGEGLREGLDQELGQAQSSGRSEAR